MTPPLHPEVGSQIDALTIDRALPLVVTDADEVLVQFIVCFEEFLASRSLYLDLRSFALTGNVRNVADNRPVDRETVGALLDDYFAVQADRVLPVPGAAEALSALSGRVQIVVLTNVPLVRREARRRGLADSGMDYPVIANLGGKGGAVAALAAKVEAPVFFIDDLPQQISSVADAAAEVRCLHFVADPRLAALLAPAPGCHHRSDEWPQAKAYIELELELLGY